MISASRIVCLVVLLWLGHSNANLVLTDQFWFTSKINGTATQRPYYPLAAGSTGMPRDGLTDIKLVSINNDTASCTSMLPSMAGSVALLYDYSCYASISQAVLKVKSLGAVAAIWCFTNLPDTPLNFQPVGIRTATYGEFPVVSASVDRDCKPLFNAISSKWDVTVSFKGSGTIDSVQLQALRDVVKSIPTATWTGLTNDRPWTDVLQAHPDDPCQRRLQGLWCEEGRVMFAFIIAANIQGTFSPSWGKFTDMRFLKLIYSGFTGAIPAQWGDMTKLSTLLLSTSSVSSLPSTITKWTAIEALGVDQAPYLTSLPTQIGSLTSLRYLSTANSPVGQLPPLASFPNLQRLYASNSGIKAALPISALSAMSSLEVFDGSNNELSLVMQANSLDTLNNLAVLRLRGNSGISGVLPHLTNNVLLTELDLSACSFTGGIPSTWLTNFKTTLTQLRLRGNKLTGPTGQLAKLKALRMLDLSHNSLVADSAITSGSNLISYLIGTNVFDADISYNKFTLPFLTTLAMAIPNLISINFAHNNFSGTLPLDYTSETMKNMVKYDFSYNLFTGIIIATPPVPWVQQFNVAGNPYLAPTAADPAVPVWIQVNPNDPWEYIPDYTGVQCPKFCEKGVCSMQVHIPPTYYSFSGCRCAPGYYGTAPYNCVTDPVPAAVEPCRRNVQANSASANRRANTLTHEVSVRQTTLARVQENKD